MPDYDMVGNEIACGTMFIRRTMYPRGVSTGYCV